MLKEYSQNLQPFFFASVFNANDRPWAAQSSELEDHNCGNSDFLFVDTEIAAEAFKGQCGYQAQSKWVHKVKVLSD